MITLQKTTEHDFPVIHRIKLRGFHRDEIVPEENLWVYLTDSYFCYNILLGTFIIGVVSGKRIPEFTTIDCIAIDKPYRRYSGEVFEALKGILGLPLVIEASGELLCRFYQMRFGFKRFSEPYSYMTLGDSGKSIRNRSNLLYLSEPGKTLSFKETEKAMKKIYLDYAEMVYLKPFLEYKKILEDG